MWKEVLIGIAGLTAWIVALQLIKRRRSIETTLGWGLSILYLVMFPDVLDLGGKSYLAAIVIVSAGLIVIRLARQNKQKAKGKYSQPSG